MSNHVQTSSPNSQDDDFIFAQEDEDRKLTETSDLNQLNQSWKILIVDDEVEVHEVTQLSLSDFIFEHKPLTFISAYSMQEAKQAIQAHPDTAIIFLDVVMETENAGLDLIQYVREELGNLAVRIILRTGQPGQAPEAFVVENYGIDDYKTKTELTAEKLFIVMVTALRAFSTIVQMLEMSQNLKLELTQYQQGESTLNLSALSERETSDRLERSLHILQQTQSQSEQHEKLEILSQWVKEITQNIIHSPNAATLYNMYMLARIARTVLRITDEHSAKLGLSQSKLATLMYLNDEPALSASPSALAEHCGISRPAMTGLLNGLEQEGYVERDSNPSDRRALNVKLTTKGQHFLDWIASQDRFQISETKLTLDEVERQNFISLAQKVLKLFEAETLAKP